VEKIDLHIPKAMYCDHVTKH